MVSHVSNWRYFSRRDSLMLELTKKRTNWTIVMIGMKIGGGQRTIFFPFSIASKYVTIWYSLEVAITRWKKKKKKGISH